MNSICSTPFIPPPNPSGYCLCGCGQRAPIATQSDYRKGILKDHPMRFIHNHHMRQRVQYLVEDRGYKSPCWIWQLTIDRCGYGKTSIKSTSRHAHRVYYERKYGTIPCGLLLDHLCRVRCCVNPDHLEPVTPVENTRRGLTCKINAEQAREIRSLKGKLTYKQIGERYGITAPAVYLIMKGHNWRGI